MPDMLVKLYKVKEDPALEARLAANGIQLKRALAPDIQRITGFVRENFGDGWANECLAGILRDGCWIAVKDKKVVGFASSCSTCNQKIVRFIDPITLGQ